MAIQIINNKRVNKYISEEKYNSSSISTTIGKKKKLPDIYDENLPIYRDRYRILTVKKEGKK